MPSQPATRQPGSTTRVSNAVILCVLCLFAYTLTTYGGIRAPDSEIVFRMAESLAHTGSCAIVHPIAGAGTFGLARGKDGKWYAIFGPLESLVEVPWILLGDALVHRACGHRSAIQVPISHYCDNGLLHYLLDTPVPNPAPHFVRFIVSFMNVLVSVLGVLLFYRILLRLAIGEFVALLVALLYAFGTMIWAYSGTLFSEPLATLCILLALLLLLPREANLLTREDSATGAPSLPPTGTGDSGGMPGFAGAASVSDWRRRRTCRPFCVRRFFSLMCYSSRAG